VSALVYPDDAFYTPQDFEFWDPEYYFPRYLKVLPKQGGRVIPFHLWDQQRILSQFIVRCYLERKWLCHVKPRKEGSSTLFLGVAVQHTAYRDGVQGMILAQRDDVTRQLAATANRFWKNLPENMRPYRMPGIKRSIECPVIDTLLGVGTAGQDDPARGYTHLNFLLATEICKWGAGAKNQEASASETWTSVLNNIHHDGCFVVAESTPLHWGDPLQKLYEKADEPDSPWLKCFIPWTTVAEYSATPPTKWEPTPEVATYAHEHGLNVRQAFWMQSIGLPKCDYKLNRFRAEYPISDLDCWIMAGERVFDVGRLMEMLRGLDQGTNLTERVEPYVEFVGPKKGHRYAIFCDPAGSWAERDQFGIFIGDLDDCEQAAEYLGHLDAYECASKLIEMSIRFNGAMVYVEANGVGEAVLSHLKHSRYPRVYHRKSIGSSRQPGWHSNKKTKAEAVSWAQEVINDGSVTLYSHRLLRQLSNYRGQWDKLARDTSGGHYDLAAAFMGWCWAWRQMTGSKRVRSTADAAEQSAINWRKVREQIKSLTETQPDGLKTPWGVHR